VNARTQPRLCREFRERFNIPISDDVIAETPFYRPPADSPETKYLLERRRELGGAGD